MIAALIFAGGTGSRMNTQAKPKQFLELYGKPIIIYTLEHFEKHPEIDDIVVVCLEGWIEALKKLLKQYAFEKVSNVVVGGEGGDISIYNGLLALSEKCDSEDIVLIHDGVRPLINEALITDNINKVKKYGISITVEASTESVVRLDSVKRIIEVPPRNDMYTAKAPQSFKFGLIWDLYKQARKDGIRILDSANLCGVYGVEMHTVISTPNNIKITAPSDFYIFRSLVEAQENKQVFGI